MLVFSRCVQSLSPFGPAPFTQGSLQAPNRAKYAEGHTCGERMYRYIRRAQHWGPRLSCSDRRASGARQSLPCAKGGVSRRLTEGLSAACFSQNACLLPLRTIPQSLRASSLYTREPSGSEKRSVAAFGSEWAGSIPPLQAAHCRGRIFPALQLDVYSTPSPRRRSWRGATPRLHKRNENENPFLGSGVSPGGEGGMGFLRELGEPRRSPWSLRPPEAFPVTRKYE